ncbi:carboxypeptidase-like regulatory domain-containing protein [Siphonobacter sp. BAB-5405]|uniref:carboxypeptidase-like regulatory domain-containing protein n=1 Tax=Siphonobacter sp. BAB-5405 TaxID=1864825 RepID=UPI001E424262|nr:carboxypeptidase-like regulatory domain-containing protein [Siphonobacter sp. BAB-5405]
MFFQRIRFTGVVLLWSVSAAFAQTLTGKVAEADSKNEPLAGANVYWLGTSIHTQTDPEGAFSIPKTADQRRLVVSLVGYQSDTLTIDSLTSITIYLKSTNQLQEVTVTSSATSIDRLNPIQTEIITKQSFGKSRLL